MIPAGYCQCGCGERTRISETTDRKHGWVRGEPRQYLRGHNRRKDWWEVDPDTGCWVWQGVVSPDGYCRVFFMGERVAHRAIYRKLRGDIPEGMQLDHLCRNRACVNPDHLEVVTQAENIRRGRATKLTHELAAAIRNADGRQVDIAAEFGIDQTHVSRIKLGKAWAA